MVEAVEEFTNFSIDGCALYVKNCAFQPFMRFGDISIDWFIDVSIQSFGLDWWVLFFI